MIQSCVAGIENAKEGKSKISSSAGFFLAIFMLICGILAIWSVLSLVFGELLLFHYFKNKDIYGNSENRN